MSKKELRSKQKPVSNNIDKDDLKKHIDKNEAQQKILKKMADILKNEKINKKK